MADLGLDQKLVEAAKAVMLEMHRLLGEYASDMAVVGGWVPPLLLPEAGETHVGSEDVDVVMNHRKVNEEAYGRVVAILEKAGYYQKGSANPFQYFRDVPQSGGDPITVQVDFLAGEYAGSGTSRRHQEYQELKARKARGADLVFEEDVRIRLEGRLPTGDRDSAEIRIAGVTAFLTMKAEALKGRQKDKDAYDIYFCMLHYPGGLDELVSAMRPLAGHGLLQEALGILAEKFGAPDHWAAGAVARAYQASGEEEARIRRDAVERVGFVVEKCRYFIGKQADRAQN